MSSQAISYVHVELRFSVSETVFVPSSGVDVMNALFTYCICTQICPLSHPRLHGKWWVESEGQRYPVLLLTVWTAVSRSAQFTLLVMGPSLQYL